MAGPPTGKTPVSGKASAKTTAKKARISKAEPLSQAVINKTKAHAKADNTNKAYGTVEKQLLLWHVTRLQEWKNWHITAQAAINSPKSTTKPHSLTSMASAESYSSFDPASPANGGASAAPDPIFGDPEAPVAFNRGVKCTPLLINMFIYDQCRLQGKGASKLDQIRAAILKMFHNMYVVMSLLL